MVFFFMQRIELMERVNLNVTVKRNILGEFFVYVTTDSPVTMREARDGRGEVGMDFGLRTFLALSDGTVIRSPEFFKQGVADIRKGQPRPEPQGVGEQRIRPCTEGDVPQTPGHVIISCKEEFL